MTEEDRQRLIRMDLGSVRTVAKGPGKHHISFTKPLFMRIVSRTDGVASVGVRGSAYKGYRFSVHGDREPVGYNIKYYDKVKRKRGRILKKLGLWSYDIDTIKL